MEFSCLACKKMIKNAVHLCCDVSPSRDKIFACRLFIKRFDLALGEEVNVSVDNLSIDDQNNEHYFFYILQCSPGKDVKSLQMEAFSALTSYMDSQLLKVEQKSVCRLTTLECACQGLINLLKNLTTTKVLGKKRTTQVP